MNTIKTSKSLLKKSRGATMAEYAVLLVAVLLVAASSYRAFGRATAKTVKSATAALNGGA